MLLIIECRNCTHKILPLYVLFTPQVSYEVTRVKSSASLVTEDIVPSKGDIFYANDEDGTKFINLEALPYGGLLIFVLFSIQVCF